MNQVIKSLPVYSEQNKQFFLDHPQLPIAVVKGFDTEVFTAPLLIDRKFSLIAISMIESEILKGSMNEMMSIGDKVALEAVYLALGNDIIKIVIPQQSSTISENRELMRIGRVIELSFTTTISLSSETLNVIGAPVKVPEEYKGTEAKVVILVRGCIVLETGETELCASLRLSSDEPEKAISMAEEYFASTKVVAFDLNYNLENPNAMSRPIEEPTEDTNSVLPVNTTPKIVPNSQREILIRGTIEYLGTLDKHQFNFLLSEVYNVGTAAGLIHFFSTRDVCELENALMISLTHDPRYKSVCEISYQYNHTVDKPRCVYMNLPHLPSTDSPLWQKAISDDIVTLPTGNNYFKAKLRTIEGTDALLYIEHIDVTATINGVTEYTLPDRWFTTDGTVEKDKKLTKETDPTIRDYSTKQCNPFAIRKKDDRAVLMFLQTDGYRDFTLNEWNNDKSHHIVNIREHLENVCTGLQIRGTLENKVYLTTNASTFSYEDVVKVLDEVESMRLDMADTFPAEPLPKVYFTKTNNLMPFAVRLKGLDDRVALMLSSAKGWYDVNWQRAFETGGDPRPTLESYLQRNCGLECYIIPGSDLLHVSGKYDDIVKTLKEAEEACSK